MNGGHSHVTSVGRRSAVLMTTVALAVGLAMVSTGQPATASPSRARATEPAAPDPPPLDWKPCEQDAECATVQVPLDYAHPTRRTIKIALLRTRATDPQRRIGSLLVNPGGPGASGLTLPLDLRQQAQDAGGSDAEIFARFDVVGFDPRGVGASTAVDCGDAISTYERTDFTPDTKGEDTALVRATKTFARACQQHSGDLLRFINTTSAARDMDQIRKALGEKTLNYLGFSYGTELGSVYADLFPKRLRAFVLDGAVDPTSYVKGVTSVKEQTVSINKAFEAFAKDCGARPDCAFYSDGDPAAAFDRLITSLEAKPLAAPLSGSTITENELVATTAIILSAFPATQEFLEQALAQAAKGDGTLMIRAFDSVFGSGTTAAPDNFVEANAAIVCVDAKWPRGAAGYDALITRLNKEFPRFAQTFQVGQLPCAYWPFPASPPRPPTARGAPPILVVGSTGDPLTSYADAQALAKQLRSAVLLTREGSGHTGYGKSACIDDAVNAFFIDLTVPPENTRCST